MNSIINIEDEMIVMEDDLLILYFRGRYSPLSHGGMRKMTLYDNKWLQVPHYK